MAQNFLSDIKLGDSIYIRLGDASPNGDFRMQHNGTHTFMDNHTGNVYIRNYSDDKNIHFQTDDGSGDVTDYIVIHGSENLIKFQEHTRHLDSKQARFGTGADMVLYHDGSHSFIRQVGTGNLYIDQAQDDQNIVFRNDDGSGGVANYFTVDGGETRTVFHKATRHADNVSASFGANQDLKIFHDGTNNQIRNENGSLDFEQHVDNGFIRFYADNGSGGLARYFYVDGSTERIQFDKQAYFVDNAKATFGSGQDLQIYHDGGTSSYINNHTGHLYFRNYADDSDIYFQSDDGSGGLTNYFYLDGSIKRTIFPQDTKHEDSVKAFFGNSYDLEIYHDGNHSYIADTGTGELRLSGNVFRVLNANASETMIYAEQDGKVQLRFNESTKFETTSAGATVTGALTVTGDLIVNGTTTTINTATVEVEDNILQLNTTQGSPDTATAATSGISVYRGDGVTQASFIFNEGDDTWDLTNNLAVAGNLGIGGLDPESGKALRIKSQSTSAQSSAIEIIQNNGSNPIIRLGERSDNKARLHMFAGNVEKIAFNTDGTNNHISAGNLGIGTNTPDGVLDVHGASGRWRVNTYGAMYFRNDNDTGNEQYIHARSDGKLSIGRAATSNWSGSGNATFFATTYDHLTFATNSDATFAGTITTTSTATGAITLNGGTGVATTGAFILRQNGDGAGNGIAITSSHATSHRIWKDASGNLNIGPSSDPDAFQQDTSGNATFAGSVDATNYKINGAQGSDGQVLTSTGSGVAWETPSTSSAFTGGTVANATTFQSDITLDDNSGASPSIYLTNGNNNYWRIFNGSSEDLTFRLGTVTKFDIDSSGNGTFTGYTSATSSYAQNFYVTSSGTNAVNRIDNDGSNLYITYGGTTTRALEIVNSNGKAIFKGNVDVVEDLKINPDYNNSNEYLFIRKHQSADGGIIMQSKTSGGSTQSDWQIVNHASTGDLKFYAYGLADHALTLDRENGNATFANNVNIPSGYVGRDSHNGVYFSTDDSIIYRVADSHRFRMDSTAFRPYTDSTYDLGTASVRWANIYTDAISVLGQGTFDTINTGQGATEVHLMNQNVRTTDNVQFGDLTVTGNLTVTGTSTSVNVEDLNVEQGEITLNYAASSDTSSSANGAGIRIQDAVNATTDATMLWNATDDRFVFSNTIQAPGLRSTTSNTFTGGMSSFETTLTNNDDWQNSPISILERGNVNATQTADKYSPNLNFHWGGVVSRSLWMDHDGHLHYGEYSASGIPDDASGHFLANEVHASVFKDKDSTGYYLDLASTGTSLNVAGAGTFAGTLGIAGSSPVSTSALTIKSQSVSSQQSAIDIIQNGTGTNSIIRMGEKSTDGARLHMFDGGTEKIAFYTDGTANHISAGNLGIGTNNATYKLQVQGTFYVNETAYINGVTTIDASLNQTGGDASTFSGDVDFDGHITLTGSSKNIVLNYNNEIRTKDSGGTERTVLRAASNKLQYGWSYAGEVEFMGGGSYTPRITINTDGSTTFAGNLYIPEYIYHDGNTTTYARFQTNRLTLQIGRAHV